MSQRPVTLFTGQWADLKIADLLPKVKAMGYEGVELACWGDHFDVVRAVNEKGYVESVWELLKKHDLGCWAISSHLVGRQQGGHQLVGERSRGFFVSRVLPRAKDATSRPPRLSGAVRQALRCRA